MSQVLDEDFIVEILAVAVKNKNFFGVLNQHLLPNHIPDPFQKKIWETFKKYYELEKVIPTLGILRQILSGDDQCLDVLVQMKQVVVHDMDAILTSLELFLKRVRFIELYEETSEMFSSGDDRKAFDKYIEGAEDLAKFSLKSTEFEGVFSDYRKRTIERTNRDTEIIRIPIGIDPLDRITNGFERGETVLFTAESGSGKSFLLIWSGLSVARRGYNVLHFQIEGTKQQVMDRYDSAWTGVEYFDMKYARLKKEQIAKQLKKIKAAVGDVKVKAFERFGDITVVDMRNSIIDYIKINGHAPDCVVIDYLELGEPGDGRVYRPSEERFRQEKLARMFKEIAMEFNCVVITATQSTTLDPQTKKDPDFVLTRYNLSEHKGKLRPFDWHITINQTPDERELSVFRLYVDKAREMKGQQVVELVHALRRSRFYDKKATMEHIEEMMDLE